MVRGAPSTQTLIRNDQSGWVGINGKEVVDATVGSVEAVTVVPGWLDGLDQSPQLNVVLNGRGMKLVKYKKWWNLLSTFWSWNNKKPWEWMWNGMKVGKVRDCRWDLCLLSGNYITWPCCIGEFSYWIPESVCVHKYHGWGSSVTGSILIKWSVVHWNGMEPWGFLLDFWFWILEFSLVCLGWEENFTEKWSNY